MVRAPMLWSGTVLVLTLPCTAAGPGLEDKVKGCCKKMYSPLKAFPLGNGIQKEHLEV